MQKHLAPPALARLETRVRDDLARIAHPARDWMLGRRGPAGEAILDVLIAGAGQGGLAVAHALQRDRVRNVLIIDRQP
jgi:threonine dehydrogenase-like Zn-dependent dehydrogenase